MESRSLDIDVRDGGRGDDFGKPGIVAGANVPEMVAEHRHLWVPEGDQPEVGLPGRSGGEARQKAPLRSSGEEGVRFVAQEPAVVPLSQVVGEAGQSKAIVELP